MLQTDTALLVAGSAGSVWLSGNKTSYCIGNWKRLLNYYSARMYLYIIIYKTIQSNILIITIELSKYVRGISNTAVFYPTKSNWSITVFIYYVTSIKYFRQNSQFNQTTNYTTL